MANPYSKQPSLRSVEERNKLILDNQRLPYFIVRKMSGMDMIKAYGEEDVVQIGFLGLIRAAEVWDENGEAKFVTYAYWCIWNKIMGEVGRWFDKQKRAAKKRRHIIKVPRYELMINDEGKAEPGIFDEDIGNKLDSEQVYSSYKGMCRTKDKVLRSHGVVLKQKFFDGYTLDEMGAKRNISGQAMRGRIDKALKALRKRVVKCNSSPTPLS